MVKKDFFIIGLICLPFFSLCQEGCTDPLAINYNSSAVTNNGSCVYDESFYAMATVSDLPSPLLNENSGLIYFASHLWTINDGGNSNSIYELDTLGNLIREISVIGAYNVDWEGLSQNDEHIYIGDFGNNSGSRADLCIYELDKSQIIDPNVTEIVAVKKLFIYEDQVQFNWPLNEHNYDCEALIASNDSLYLFTKNWLNEEVNIYVLPSQWADTAAAILIESFNSEGFITDASRDPESGNTMLLGYKNNGANLYTSFVWILWDHEPFDFFGGNKRRIEIGSVFTLGQTEGLALRNGQEGFVSGEQISSVITIAPKLSRFDFSEYLFQGNANISELHEGKLPLYPNPVYNQIFLSENTGAFQIYKTKTLQLVLAGELTSNRLDISHLVGGSYLLKTPRATQRFLKVNSPN